MNSFIRKLQPVKPLSIKQQIACYLLAALLLVTGTGHESFSRREFQAQVPNWLPMNKDLVVVLSGIVELGLAAALAAARRKRILMGFTLAVFFILVFPGNIAQYVNHRDAFGLNTDLARGIRLLFQPVLIIWVLWATGTLDNLKSNGICKG